MMDLHLRLLEKTILSEFMIISLKNQSNNQKVLNEINLDIVIEYSVQNLIKEDPNIISSGGWDQNVYIRDLRISQVVKKLNGPKIGGQCIDIHQDMVLTGSNVSTQQIKIWSFKQQKVLSPFKWDGDAKQSGASIFSCSFSGLDKNIILVAGGNQMKLYSLQKRINFQQHFKSVNRITYILLTQVQIIQNI